MRWSVPYRHSTLLHQRVACQTLFHDGYILSRCHLRVHAYVALYGTATSALPNPSHPSSFHIPFLHLLGVLDFSTFLVCFRPPKFWGGPSSTSARTFPVAAVQQRTGIPPLPLSLLPSRVETKRRGLFAAGFSSAAAEMYLLSHIVSTTGQCQSIWTKFLRFLSSNGYSSKDTSVASVCNFLKFQATVCKLQYKTISGYRSTLRLPLYWGCGLVVSDFVSDRFLKGLFNLIPPRRAAPMSIWRLNILLSYLQSGRFEPLDSVSPELLFQGTLCLLLLASGRRICEIAHLSRLFRLDQSGNSLTLDWVDGFRPKHDDSVFRPDSPYISCLASDGSVSLSI